MRQRPVRVAQRGSHVAPDYYRMREARALDAYGDGVIALSPCRTRSEHQRGAHQKTNAAEEFHFRTPSRQATPQSFIAQGASSMPRWPVVANSAGEIRL